jgi:hypothetical protein
MVTRREREAVAEATVRLLSDLNHALPPMDRQRPSVDYEDGGDGVACSGGETPPHD